MKSRFRIRNKENNGWYVVSSMDLQEEHKQLFMALNGRVTTFRDVLVLLDAIGISNINDSLNKIQECLDKNEIEYDPIEEPEVKKGWLHKLFK
jgi:hypothetical protein